VSLRAETRYEVTLWPPHNVGRQPAAPMADEAGDFEILEIAVRKLAIEKGLFTAEDHRKSAEWAEQIGPVGGLRLVVNAWSNPAFKSRMLSGRQHDADEGAGSIAQGRDLDPGAALGSRDGPAPGSAVPSPPPDVGQLERLLEKDKGPDHDVLAAWSAEGDVRVDARRMERPA